MSEDTPTLGNLFEDVEDLRAIVNGFASQLEHNTNVVNQLAAKPPSDGPAEGDGQKKKEKEEKPKAPPFILRLSNPQFACELAALDTWVRSVLVPTYVSEVKATHPWCAQWWQHDEAYARLHACWLAWQSLTDPESGGYAGPSVWHRDHLDPMLDRLRSPDGPFAACMTTEHQQHSVLPVPPAVPVPYVPPAPADDEPKEG